MRNKIFLFLSVLLLTITLNFVSNPLIAADPASPENVYVGKVLDKSNKAKVISIQVGKGDKAKTIMVKFNNQTTGLNYAAKDNVAIIKYKIIDNEKTATEIKPKIADLPQGAVEVQASHVVSKITQGIEKGKYFLVDSRPASRYHEGTIPTAVSIPVPKLEKEGAALLPQDKDTELIFFCGGPT